jgi:hypothetical protein
MKSDSIKTMIVELEGKKQKLDQAIESLRAVADMDGALPVRAPELQDKPTIDEAILAHLQKAKRPQRQDQIYKAVAAVGATNNRESVVTALFRLQFRKKVNHPGYNKWEAKKP